ncbi:MAG: diguanylate cyclase [Rubrivivax sp.]|nr:diguanylate cyclase [Rubrivivax sp.]
MKALPPDPAATERSVAEAEAALLRLGGEVEAMKAVLVRLLQDVVDAERCLAHNQAAQLVEANEQLVLAALRSQSDADTAQQALADAAQATAVDALTGLQTRHTLLDRFAQGVAQARRHGRRCALLFVDLDDFKRLNDSRGHAFGDRVLRQVAGRMVAAVREVDTVSRHGGDEFLILLADLAQAADAQAVADKVVRALAIYPDDGEDVDTLVERADAAMYASKRQRRGGVAFHGVEPASSPLPAAVPGVATAEVERRLANLREANEKLVLAALSAQELRAAAEQARERQAAFLKAVAAELRNPQAPVRIASAMLGQAPGQEPLLSRVQRAVDHRMTHMARLVGELVDATRSDAGQLVLQHQTVDLVAAVDAAVAVQRPAFERRGLCLQWQRPAQPIELDADPARLDQMLANLLDHAGAYTPDRGHIAVSAGADDDRVTLTVSDDGMGITPPALPRVFEPFAQAVHALDVEGPSLGLGLTAVRAIVSAHGGEVTAHSDGLHRGSRFVVTLPRHR